MRAASHLSVVQAGERPPPMMPADVDLSDMPKAMIPLDMVRSPWALTCEDAEFRAGITLWCASFHQTPAGSLPNDNRILARLADLGRNVGLFESLREKALEGWELCSDGRLYRRSVAIEALAFWIKRLMKRKANAASHAARWERDEVPDTDAFDRQIFAAGDALSRLEATHPLVARIKAHRAKAARTAENVETLAPPFSSEQNVCHDDSHEKVSEAKRSQEYSSEQSSLDARAPDDPDRVIVATRSESSQPVPWDPWPDDWWERFWAAVWLQVGTGAARRALDKTRKRKLVTFDALLAGVERYKRSKPDWQEWCHPATWINQQRWRDGDPVAAAARPAALGPAVVEMVFVERDTPPWKAWQAHARRLGKAGFPDSQQQGSKRGWRFPTLWPPPAPA